MMNEEQFSVMLYNIRSDITMFTNSIERNNKECTRLSAETIEHHKALNNLKDVECECIAELDAIQELKSLNVVVSTEEVCQRCGAVTLVLIGDPDRYEEADFCDDCIKEMRDKRRPYHDVN